MSVTATYDSTISRVRVVATDAFTAEYITVQRRVPGGLWTTVRGGGELAVPAAVDDYEFIPGVVNTYRAQSYSPVDVLLGTESGTVTPTIIQPWLKSITRPFLNMPVTIQEYTQIARQSRAGVFNVPGRSFPVRVGDVASSRSWSYQILTADLAEARSLEYLIQSGDVIFVQVPTGFDIPAGYVGVGDMDLSRVSRTLADDRRLFSLPVVEVAPPAASVVGYTATWAGLLAEFGTWADVLAEFGTWAEVLEHVSDPSIVVVP